jgi:internalin A
MDNQLTQYSFTTAHQTRRTAAFMLFLTSLLLGCADDAGSQAESEAPPVMRAAPSDEPEFISASELRQKLRANEKAKFPRVGNDIVGAELFESGVKSIGALRGLPLRSIDLGMTEVTDISPLEGMPLERVILEDTTVDDISVLKGMQLEVLYLQNTKVADLSVLEGMPLRELNLMNVPVDDLTTIAKLPLQTLWIPGTQVTDISPLKGKSLVSLDIEDTKVPSIDALAGMTSLKRLNIANTPVTDVSPLKGLKLERITVTPGTVTSGMEVLRDMPSLGQILTTMAGESRQSAAEFWQKYDAGVWKETPDNTPNNDADKSPADNETDPAKEETGKEPPAASKDEAPNNPAPSKPEGQSTEQLPPSK